jgi:hypothetical protein
MVEFRLMTVTKANDFFSCKIYNYVVGLLFWRKKKQQLWTADTFHAHKPNIFFLFYHYDIWQNTEVLLLIKLHHTNHKISQQPRKNTLKWISQLLAQQFYISICGRNRTTWCHLRQLNRHNLNGQITPPMKKACLKLCCSPYETSECEALPLTTRSMGWSFKLYGVASAIFL